MSGPCSPRVAAVTEFPVGSPLVPRFRVCRRTRDGRLALSFPERRDLAGGSHHYMRPLNDAARRAIEAQVFAALGLEGNVGP